MAYGDMPENRPADFILTPSDDVKRRRTAVTRITDGGRTAEIHGGSAKAHAAAVQVAQRVLKEMRNKPIGPDDPERIRELIRRFSAEPHSTKNVKKPGGGRRGSS